MDKYTQYVWGTPAEVCINRQRQEIHFEAIERFERTQRYCVVHSYDSNRQIYWRITKECFTEEKDHGSPGKKLRRWQGMVLALDRIHILIPSLPIQILNSY